MIAYNLCHASATWAFPLDLTGVRRHDLRLTVPHLLEMTDKLNFAPITITTF